MKHSAAARPHVPRSRLQIAGLDPKVLFKLVFVHVGPPLNAALYALRFPFLTFLFSLSILVFKARLELQSGMEPPKQPPKQKITHNPLLYKEIMKTKALIIFYLLTKLLFLAALFVRLEGRRLVKRRVRGWSVRA